MRVRVCPTPTPGPHLRKYARVAPADCIMLPRAVTNRGVSAGRRTPSENSGEKPLRHSQSHSGSISCESGMLRGERRTWLGLALGLGLG